MFQVLGGKFDPDSKKSNEYSKEDINELEKLGVVSKELELDFDPELNLEKSQKTKEFGVCFHHY